MTHLAAVFGAREIDVFTQHFEQRLVGVEGALDIGAVDVGKTFIIGSQKKVRIFYPRNHLRLGILLLQHRQSFARGSHADRVKIGRAHGGDHSRPLGFIRANQ